MSSVNDGAPWIERITGTNFSHAQQIIDWAHAKKRLWAVANEVCGEQTPQANARVEHQLADLWEGRTPEVVRALDSLSLDASRYSSEVQQAPDYFRSRESKMHYDRFRAEGYPIGSGTVESAAHTVVHDRMHRPGRGWKRDNAQAMLAGLSELHDACPAPATCGQPVARADWMTTDARRALKKSYFSPQRRRGRGVLLEISLRSPRLCGEREGFSAIS